ncbi:nucleoporin Gle1 [Drosophila pseudoobscura]|uniref:mRNA export factor GLE1 n=1 Tax=Drosophila pseudoobscura pseudoobscura TaxID=46245 RepID=A0A6I8UW16_DROPS|nr:nucleoporin Gle1 [Drosophila pseudoobscura]
MSVENVIREMDSLHLETVFKHAAIASLTCKGRTLGPDREPFWVEGQKESLDEGIVNAEETVVEKTIVSPSIRDKEPSLSCFPDAGEINASIFRREMAEQCKRSVRKQIQALKEAHKGLQIQCDSRQREEDQQKERLAQKALREQNDNLINQKAEQLAQGQLEAQQRQQLDLRKKTDQKLHKLALEGVSRCQRRFGNKYEGIIKLLLSLDKETVQVCAAQNQQLRELGEKFDDLVCTVKMGNFEQSQYLSSIIKAEQYCKNLDDLEADMIKELAEFSELIQQQIKMEAAQRLEEEKQRQLEEEKKQFEEQTQRQKEKDESEAQQRQKLAEEAAKAEAAKATPPPEENSVDVSPAEGTISTSYVHPSRLAFYNEIISLYQTKVDAVKPLQSEESLKQYRTGCQRAINLPLNAITAVSPQHLSNNFEKLYNFFAGHSVRVMNDATITINDHPLARDYCMLLMAKKFVSQSETAISGNPQAAFPFASVIVTFWKLLPDFGKVFLAYLYKESPYLVPYVIPQQPGQTAEQYLKSIGYRLSDKNELEKPDMFLKRQTGIARLYAAVIITPGRKADGPAHCFGLEEGWRWLAHVVHVKPLPDISATLIMEILQTLGFELWRTYGKQFLKLLLYIHISYMPQLAIYDEGGPKTRLEMLLAKFLRERQIPQTVGILPPGFW